MTEVKFATGKKLTEFEQGLAKFWANSLRHMGKITAILSMFRQLLWANLHLSKPVRAISHLPNSQREH